MLDCPGDETDIILFRCWSRYRFPSSFLLFAKGTLLVRPKINHSNVKLLITTAYRVVQYRLELPICVTVLRREVSSQGKVIHQQHKDCMFCICICFFCCLEYHTNSILSIFHSECLSTTIENHHSLVLHRSTGRDLKGRGTAFEVRGTDRYRTS